MYCRIVPVEVVAVAVMVVAMMAKQYAKNSYGRNAGTIPVTATRADRTGNSHVDYVENDTSHVD